LGSIDLGDSGTATVIVTNNGTGASGALVVTPSAPTIAVSGCAAPLAAKTSCNLIVTATPTAIGSFAGSISITAAPGAVTPIQISVSASVAAGGMFTVSVPSIDLGNVLVGAPASKQTLTVTALVALTDLSVSVSGADVTKDASSTCSASLAANAPCTVVVTFAATANGARNDSVVISAGGAKGVTKEIPISANAQNPAKLVISPAVAPLVATSVGLPGSPIPFGVTNSGDLPTGAIVVTVTGANAKDFIATPSAGCTLIAPLATACTISVVFNPAAASAALEAAILNVSDTGLAGSTVSVALSGTAYSASLLAITPATSDLGSVAVGSAGAVTTFTVTNTGDTASDALVVSLSTAEFVKASDTCSGLTLAAKTGTCTVGVQLKPASAGAKTAILQIGGASLPAVKTLTGTGTAIPAPANLTASPLSLDFQSVRVTTTSTAQVVTVTNSGGVATGPLTFTKAGDFAQFPIVNNTCSAALAPLATCSFSVTFAPTDASNPSLSAAYTVTDGADTVTVSVSGTALSAAGLTLAPTAVISCQDPLGTASTLLGCLNNTVVGGTSNTSVFTVTMPKLPTGATDSGALTVSLIGANKADFSIVANTCTTPLFATATCTVTVAATPTATGLRQAALSVTSANGGSITSTLSANGLAVLEIDGATTKAAPNTIVATPVLDFGQVPVDATAATITALNNSNRNVYSVLVRGPHGATAATSTTTVTVALADTASPSNFRYPTGVVSNPCTGTILDFSVTPVAGAGPGNWKWVAAQFAYACFFTVDFLPQTTEGAETATITASGTGGGTDTKTLTGIATGPLVFTPSPAAFSGSVAIGDSTNDGIAVTNLTLTLSNTSATNDEGPISIALAGTNKDQFVIAGDACSFATLAKGGAATCKVTLSFVPTTVGAKTATITATAGTGTAVETAAVTVNALAGPDFPLQVNGSATPAAVDFGTIVQTAASPWVTFTVTNPATAATSAQIGYGIAGADFVLADGSASAPRGTCGISGSKQLVAGASCTILARFMPKNTDAISTATTGIQTGTLTIQGGGAGVPVALTGKVSSQVAISPTTHDFGNVGEGSASAPFTLTLTNNGAAAATVTFNSGLAPINVVTTDCTAALAPAATCSVVATYNGEVGNDVARTKTLTATVTGSSGAAFASATLTGTTVTPANLVAVGLNPAAATGSQVINLGSVRKGQTSGNVTLLFQNTGSVPTSALEYQWGTAAVNTADGQFNIVSEATTGCVGRSSLAAQATCTVTINFTAASGSTAGTTVTKGFTLSANQGGVVDVFALSATPIATTGSAYYSTATVQAFYAFPGTTISGAATPPTQIFTFTNATGLGIAVADVIAITPNTAGVNPNFVVDPTLGSAPCSVLSPATVPASGSCTFSVAFQPAAWTAITADRVATIGTGATTLGLFGVVQSPAKLTLLPAPVTFGQVVVGTTSAAQTFTVTNVGQTKSGVVTLPVTGANPTLFVTGGNCTAALDPGASCVGTVSVVPQNNSGDLAANIKATDGTVSSATTALTATGVNDTVLGLPATTAAVTGTTAVGKTSATLTVAVTNAAGARDSGVLAIALADTTNFALVAPGSGTACSTLSGATPPVGLAGGATCTVGIAFKPQSLGTAGAFTTNLTVTGTPGGAKSMAITATAISALSISPAGPVVIDSTTTLANRTITVTLAAGAPETAYLTTSISGGSYFIASDGCVATILDGGGTCQLVLEFVATAATPKKTGTLTVSGGTPGSTATLVVNSL
jgi:hypothetical protein